MNQRGLTLIELLICLGIVGILASIAGKLYGETLERARVTRAAADIRTIERLLTSRESEGTLPADLDALGWRQQDPWGQDYRYANFALADPKSLAKDDGKPKDARRDKFLKPLNSTYDLYSVGKDGESKPSLKDKLSWDDVIRAADGAFVGPASDF